MPIKKSNSKLLTVVTWTDQQQQELPYHLELSLMMFSFKSNQESELHTK
jgi:hypothetical protein